MSSCPVVASTACGVPRTVRRAGSDREGGHAKCNHEDAKTRRTRRLAGVLLEGGRAPRQSTSTRFVSPRFGPVVNDDDLAPAPRLIHSALTMRRGTPSTRTVKSPGSRSAIGRPFPSTTVTSTEVTSTPLRNCGGSWACARTQIDSASVEASSQLYFVASCLCWDAIGKADLIRSALHNLYSNLQPPTSNLQPPTLRGTMAFFRRTSGRCRQ